MTGKDLEEEELTPSRIIHPSLTPIGDAVPVLLAPTFLPSRPSIRASPLDLPILLPVFFPQTSSSLLTALNRPLSSLIPLNCTSHGRPSIPHNRRGYSCCRHPISGILLRRRAILRYNHIHQHTHPRGPHPSSSVLFPDTSPGCPLH